jgi:hypothetical protein
MFPSSLIKTSTCTAPLVLTARAAGGYTGLGKKEALPFTTPPENAFSAPGMREAGVPLIVNFVFFSLGFGGDAGLSWAETDVRRSETNKIKRDMFFIMATRRRYHRCK